MPSLYSQTIETLTPVLTITCADAMAEYTAKKASRGGPETSLEEADKLTACMMATSAKLKGTPCDEIRFAYGACLRGGSRLSCRHLKEQLEECTAKHLGKLD